MFLLQTHGWILENHRNFQEKLHLAYSVGRAPSDQQSVIKQEVIDRRFHDVRPREVRIFRIFHCLVTYEPELEERPAEAHISQSLPGPSQVGSS